MEVVKEQEHLLSNYEVLKVLESATIYRDSYKYGSDFPTLRYELMQYLKSTGTESMSEEMLQRACQEFTRFGLTKGEKLQIVNHRPKTLAELVTMVEKFGNRQNLESDQSINELMDLINEMFHAGGDEDVGDDEEFDIE